MNRDFKLYKNEKQIVEIVKRKLNDYNVSDNELERKQNELFHLLCFLEILGEMELYKHIEPNEPGDFIIKDKDDLTLIEVTTCIVGWKSNSYLSNRLDELFERNKNSDELYYFTIAQSREKFKRLLSKKSAKEYMNNKKYNRKVLLLVTGEYEKCFPFWVIDNLSIEDISNNKFDKIMVLDYFSSGRDGNPTIIEDLEKEILKKR